VPSSHAGQTSQVNKRLFKFEGLFFFSRLPASVLTLLTLATYRPKKSWNLWLTDIKGGIWWYFSTNTRLIFMAIFPADLNAPRSGDDLARRTEGCLHSIQVESQGMNSKLRGKVKKSERLPLR
jgi:hypothetical protein